MKKYKFLLGFCLAFLAYSELNAQIERKDTTIRYNHKPILFENERVQIFGSNQQIFKGEDFTPTQKLSNFLDKQTGAFVKQYGLGGLATLSNRGGTASQTQVLWEGMSIQNPMLGQTDLSLLPLALIDRLTLTTIDNTGGAGSASLGGILSLQTLSPLAKRSDTSGWKVESTTISGAGQFGRLNFAQKLGLIGQKQAFVFRASAENARNNFWFRDVNAFGTNKPLKRLTNNHLTQYNILTEWYYEPATNQKIELKSWFQHSLRQIPPTLLQTNTDEQQKDLSFRAVLGYKRGGKKHIWNFQQGAIWEKLDYWGAALRSESSFWMLNSQAHFTAFVNSRKTLSFSAQYAYNQAVTSGYDSQKKQQRGLIFGNYKQEFLPKKTLILLLNARYELQPGYAGAKNGFWGGGVGVDWLFLDKIKAFLQFQRNYRIPTLNDLYWSVGGNPNLSPESSLVAECGLKNSQPNRPKNGFFSTDWSLQGFAGGIHSQIIWLPDPRTGLWAVQNIANRVRNMGLSAEVIPKMSFRAHTFSLQAQYTLTKALLAPQKQLIYTPTHKLNTTFAYAWGKKLQVTYAHQFTSLRYLDTDNTLYLPAFQTADLTLSGAWKKVGWWATIHNIWNADYQVVANRPMPRAWGELGLSWSLN